MMTLVQEYGVHQLPANLICRPELALWIFVN